LGRFEVRVEADSELVRFLFDASAVDGFAEFPGFRLNSKELLLPWNSVSGLQKKEL
jgi:hypothetical protein